MLNMNEYSLPTEAEWVMYRIGIKSKGVNVSVRIEGFYLNILEKLAKKEGRSLPVMLAAVRTEAGIAYDDIPNFTSFLKIFAVKNAHLVK